MLKTLLIKLYNSMIPRKAGKFSLPGLERHTGENFIRFHLSYDMPREKLALGQNSTEIMSSDKSNSSAMFLRIRTDNAMECHVRTTFALKCRSK